MEKWKHIKEKKQNYNFIFIHTPKCGGTYIKNILNESKIPWKENHKTSTTEDIKNNIVFTIFRHPLSRFESMLNFRITQCFFKNEHIKKNVHKKINLQELIKILTNPDFHKIKNTFGEHYLNPNITLNNIINKLSDEQIKNFKPFGFLKKFSENVDIILTMDNIYNFFDYFNIKYKKNYVKINVSKKKCGTFNNKIKKRLSKIFKEDIEIFNNINK